MKKATRQNARVAGSRRGRTRKEETLLASVAESIGATLGVIAAKAGAATSALRARRLRQAARRKKARG